MEQFKSGRPPTTTFSSSPFTPAVLACPLPPRFRSSMIDLFDGLEDPSDHLEVFQLHMHLQSYLDAILYRAFFLTFKGPVHKWFFNLPPASIDTFEQFNSLFIGHFVSNRRIRRPTSYLFDIKQESKKNSRSYIAWFNQEAVIVAHAADNILEKY